jgi:hypothetical protein
MHQITVMDDCNDILFLNELEMVASLMVGRNHVLMSDVLVMMVIVFDVNNGNIFLTQC